jgi:triphosphoribosyl-dephospho-CoA synthase
MDELTLDVATACIWEAQARKLGNVHPGQSFADMTFSDFVISAQAIAPILANPSNVGHKVYDAVQATQRAVGKNTNLGIILLLAPLTTTSATVSIDEVLNRLTIDDATRVYQAIRLANPGGLGQASSQSVSDEPTVTLKAAMALAADRDQIARQYTNGFHEILHFGIDTFRQAYPFQSSVEFAILETQLHWLAKFPDSLIARKNGPAIAGDVCHRAREILDLGGWRSAAGRAALKVFDGSLRRPGHRLNPGTTADILAAILFIALRERIVTQDSPFVWEQAE